ncbi:MAG: Gfo/Idh/MocA family oxidoreductase [Lentisphaerae bacterium]|nr:Gfo/Idh/MocA family oxidoreductase [Lentisphaerota bacterium]
MLKVCVIGMGHIGNLHARIYKENPKVKLIGVCDIKQERADKAAISLGVKGYYDAPTMLKELSPDLCSITTSGYENGSDHYKPTIEALNAGCHVLSEKPICNEIEPAEIMVETARSKGLCFGVNMNHRFTPAAELAKKWINENKLGHLLFVNMSMWIMNPNESSPWFQIKSLHPHTVDVMRYFCGDIEAVHCFASKAPGRQIWSNAQFNMRFKNGVIGALTGSYDIQRGHPMERCEVAGTGGRFVLEDLFREVTLYPAGNLEKTVYTNPFFGGMRDFDDTFRNRINTFVEQVARGDSPEDIDASGADGLAAQKVLSAACESVRTGNVIEIR